MDETKRCKRHTHIYAQPRPSTHATQLVMKQLQFWEACDGGDAYEAQRLLAQLPEEVLPFAGDSFAIKLAVAGGHVALAKWLYDLEGRPGVLHTIWRYLVAYPQTSFSVETVTTLWEVTNASWFFSGVLQESYGRLDVCQWLIEHGHASKDDLALGAACGWGKLDVVRWVWDMLPDGKRVVDTETFREALESGAREVAEWTYSRLDKKELRGNVVIELAMPVVCSRHTALVSWFFALPEIPAAFSGMTEKQWVQITLIVIQGACSSGNLGNVMCLSDFFASQGRPWRLVDAFFQPTWWSHLPYHCSFELLRWCEANVLPLRKDWDMSMMSQTDVAALKWQRDQGFAPTYWSVFSAVLDVRGDNIDEKLQVFCDFPSWEQTVDFFTSKFYSHVYSSRACLPILRWMHAHNFLQVENRSEVCLMALG
jgi:hypothetical protein